MILVTTTILPSCTYFNRGKIDERTKDVITWAIREGPKGIRNVYDCDDKSQVGIDELVATGKFTYDDFRMVIGINEATREKHLWNEVKLKQGWRTNDPTRKMYCEPTEKGRKGYEIIRVIPGRTIYDDKTGYKDRGDKFDKEKREWVRANQP